jgi:FemAB-related protein (PEP-CTERM system-associated)
MITAKICEDPVLWDSFVESMPEASNYHRWIWRRAIEDTFGHKGYYLAAGDGGIQAVLPLFCVRSRMFGSSLVSVPFFSYGGVLDRSAEARDVLLSLAIDLANQLNVPHIELRQGNPIDIKWRETASKVTMEMQLPPGSEELWNSLNTGMRNKIRNGRKQGFRIQWGGVEDVRHFYPIFAANMRNLGSPVYPRSWFENMCRSCPEVRVLSLWDGGQAVASAFLVGSGQTLEVPWSASLPESRKKYAPVLMYWTFLEWAAQNGYRRVDLGRCTPGGGTYEFKRHWNPEERALHWYHWLAPEARLPDVRPDNTRYHLAVQMWKHLPLPIANILGPRIVRGIP